MGSAASWLGVCEGLRVPERDRFLLGDAPLMASAEVDDAMAGRATVVVVMFMPDAAKTALAFCLPSRIALFSPAAVSSPLMLGGASAGWTAPSPWTPLSDAPSWACGDSSSCGSAMEEAGIAHGEVLRAARAACGETGAGC